VAVPARPDPAKESPNAPIAVFDSGVGGLTVLRELLRRLPAQRFVYFGDTARVPYGTKSPATITRYALELMLYVGRFHPRVIVVACNTASAVAIERLRRSSPVPVCGVVEPGARRAAQVTRNRRVGVIATEATIRSRAYHRAIRRVRPRVRVVGRSCPLLVPMVEEGRDSEDPLVRRAVREYLSGLKRARVDTVLLGCTHYPLLKGAVKRAMGEGVTVVDSAEETALAVQAMVPGAGRGKAGGSASW